MSAFIGRGRLIRRTEAHVIALVTIAAVLGCEAFNLFVAFAYPVEREQMWELEELLWILLIICAAALILAVRRAHDMTWEMGRREEAEARALALARHDPLTGLPIGACFRRSLARCSTSRGNPAGDVRC
ncbi:MAG: hypothetical protein ABI810_06520 [Sphingomonas bacterium]